MIPIAFPLATDEQIRMINSYIENNTNLITGIKSCLKEINRESKGVLVLMGDTSPMDLITHLPGLCEEKNIKYIFVKSRKLLLKDYTSLFIHKKSYEELYNSILLSNN